MKSVNNNNTHQKGVVLPPFFVDINECDNGFNDCYFTASCTNVPGSYFCKCIEGYVGDGKHCEGKASIDCRIEHCLGHL